MPTCQLCGRSGMLLKTITLDGRDHCDGCVVQQYKKLAAFKERWQVIPDAEKEAEHVLNSARQEASRLVAEAIESANVISCSARNDAEVLRSEAERTSQSIVNDANSAATRAISQAELEADKMRMLAEERRRDADMVIASTEQRIAALFASAAKSFRLDAEVAAAKATSATGKAPAASDLTARSSGLTALRKAANGEYVVLDVETTGLSKYSHRITEVGSIKIRNGVEAGRYRTLVNPQMPIPDEVQKLTGITNGMVSDAPIISDVLPKLFEFIGDALVVAHNAEFDVGFLTQEMQRCSFRASLQYVDTLTLARRRFPGLPSYRLCTVAEALCIEAGTAHRAMGDCETLKGLVEKILEES